MFDTGEMTTLRSSRPQVPLIADMGRNNRQDDLG